MKIKRLLIFISLLAIISSYIIPFSASADSITSTYSSNIVYSTQSNSGIRHVVCTSTEGTGISDYYTGSYSIENLFELSGNSLKNSLRTFMTSTHTKLSNYDNCRDYTTITDCEGNNGRITMIYSSYSATYSQYNKGQGWNREHVWPKSLGGFNQSQGGSDLHHIRPTEQVINSTRNNNKYGYAPNGKNTIGNLSGQSGGFLKTPYYEPLDNVKGDVARICLYVHVRWGNVHAPCEDITNVFQSIDVLLEWCELDPVDTWEMGRNEVVQNIQGNRNVFIDYPELAWLMFNREVPSDMTTPSGIAKSGNIGGGDGGGTPDTDECTHKSTSIKDQKIASCTEEGYTGDLRCDSCNKLITSGHTIPTLPHSFDEGIITKHPSHLDTGILTYTCITCGQAKNEILDKNNDHAIKDWTPSTDGQNHTGTCECGAVTNESHVFDTGSVTKKPTHTETGTTTYTCTVCNYSKEEPIDKTPEHSFGDWRPDQTATYHIKTCICGEKKASVHRFDNGVVTKEATHTQSGNKKYTCVDCGYSKNEGIKKLPDHTLSDWMPTSDGQNHFKKCECGLTETYPHNFGEAVITKEATHIELGSMSYTCTDCGYIKTESIDKLPDHSFGEWENVVGELMHSRSCECGLIEKLEHQFDSIITTNEPTHTTLGTKVLTCSVCQHTRIETIEKLPEHTFNKYEASSSPANHFNICECGEKKTETHNFNPGTITKKPTPFEMGEICYICTDCGYEKTESVDKSFEVLLGIIIAVLIVVLIPLAIVIIKNNKLRR